MRSTLSIPPFRPDRYGVCTPMVGGTVPDAIAPGGSCLPTGRRGDESRGRPVGPFRSDEERKLEERTMPSPDTEPTFSRATLTAVSAAFLVAIASGGLQAQQQPAPQDIEVDDQELRTFTETHIEIEEVRAEIQAKMQEAEGRQEAQQIQQQANQQMMQIIEAEDDITVERYSQIASAVNGNAELRERFQQLKDRLLEDEEEDPTGR